MRARGNGRMRPVTDELAPEIEALRKVPFFEDLTPEDLERIATIG